MEAPTSFETREVVSAIRAAFDGRPHPGAGQIVFADSKTDEAAEVALKYGRIAWQDIPRETIGYNADDLCFMTPAAFVYFLPRFLIDALERYDDPNSAIPEDVIFQLTRQPESSVLDSRLALMSDIEKRTTARFLAQIRSMAAAEESYITSRADEALASVWHEFMPPGPDQT